MCSAHNIIFISLYLVWMDMHVLCILYWICTHVHIHHVWYCILYVMLLLYINLLTYPKFQTQKLQFSAINHAAIFPGSLLPLHSPIGGQGKIAWSHPSHSSFTDIWQWISQEPALGRSKVEIEPLFGCGFLSLNERKQLPKLYNIRLQPFLEEGCATYL